MKNDERTSGLPDRIECMHPSERAEWWASAEASVGGAGANVRRVFASLAAFGPHTITATVSDVDDFDVWGRALAGFQQPHPAASPFARERAAYRRLGWATTVAREEFARLRERGACRVGALVDAMAARIAVGIRASWTVGVEIDVITVRDGRGGPLLASVPLSSYQDETGNGKNWYALVVGF